MSAVDRLLAEHVSLRITSIDRIGVGGYIRALCFEGAVVKFLLYRPAMLNSETHIPSPALLGHNHDRLLERMTAWAKSVGAQQTKPFGEMEVERKCRRRRPSC